MRAIGAAARRRALLYDQRLTLASITSLIERQVRLKAEDLSRFEIAREASASPLGASPNWDRAEILALPASW